MRLTAPLGLGAAALTLPLVVWYVLRARRPRVDVASTYLWRQTTRSVAAAVPWQRFRPDRTFWLVLAALLAAALALSRPGIPTRAELGDHTIVVVDTSMSMQADEDGPTRLELARRRARELADRLGPGQVLSVVEAGSRARVAISASGDGRAVSRAVGGLRAGGGASDLADAFTLAASLQRPGEDTVTYLLSDGPVADADLALAPPGTLVERLGRDRPNLAVTRLQAVPEAGGSQAFVSVRSFDQLPVRATLTLTMDGVEFDQRQVDLPPRGAEDLLVEIPSRTGGGVLRASLRPVGGNGTRSRDALAVDDVATAVVAPPRNVRVLVAGEGNVYLEAAFAAVEGVSVSTAPRVPADLSEVDLLVVDGIAAPARLSTPTLFVAPTRPPPGVTAAGTVALPVVTSVDTEAPVLTDVDLTDVAIASAQRVDAPTLSAAVAGPQGPLLLTGRLESFPVVYLPFDLRESNLPLQVAWPVLVANVVGELAGPAAPAPLVAGTVAPLPVAAAATTVTVTPPTGDVIRLDPAAAQVRLDSAGLWEVAYEPSGTAEPVLLAVNADPAESDLARGDPGPPPARPAGARVEAVAGLRVFGPGLLVVPLVLLLTDAVLRPRRRRMRAGSAA